MAVPADLAHPHARYSPMDSDRFGVAIARADALTPGTLPSVLEACRGAGIDMLIGRCAAADLAAVHALEDAGLRLMDAQVLFERDLTGRIQAHGTNVRPLHDGDAELVVAMAAEAFRGYGGHYHADPRLPRDRCDEAYTSWARRCCVGEAAEVVLIADLEGRPAGFSAFGRVADDEGRLLLGAVAGWARGHRLYTALALAGMAWCRERGLGRMSAITQTTNLASQHSWIRAGMLPRDGWYTFHGWLDEQAQD